MHHQNQEILTALQNCIAECNHCTTACLNEDNVKMLSRCIKLDIDCAEVCSVTAALITRGSEIAPQFVQLCADVCKMCEEECEKHQDMHSHCKDCAEACRNCYNACKNYHHVGVSDEEIR